MVFPENVSLRIVNDHFISALASAKADTSADVYCCNCVVSQAAMAVFPDRTIWTTYDSITIQKGDVQLAKYRLDDVAQAVIDWFDSHWNTEDASQLVFNKVTAELTLMS